MTIDSNALVGTAADTAGLVPDELLASAMRQAIDCAARARRPFGSALVDVASGCVTHCRANTTREDVDPFAHAEINVLRAAARAGLDTSSQILVTTAEPCPMCASAAVFAKVKGIVFGTSIATLGQLGFRQIPLSAADIVRYSEAPITVRPLFLNTETDVLYQSFRPDHMEVKK